MNGNCGFCVCSGEHLTESCDDGICGSDRRHDCCESFCYASGLPFVCLFFPTSSHFHSRTSKISQLMTIKMLFFALLLPVLSYCVLFSSFLSYLVPFYPIPPCLFLSLPILFFSLWSCSLLSCPVLSCPLTSAPRLLYPGRRAGAGLFLWDFSGMRLGSQPASTGREPLQCASADAQVDRTSPADSDSPPPKPPLLAFCFFPTSLFCFSPPAG